MRAQPSGHFARRMNRGPKKRLHGQKKMAGSLLGSQQSLLNEQLTRDIPRKRSDSPKGGRHVVTQKVLAEIGLIRTHQCTPLHRLATIQLRLLGQHEMMRHRPQCKWQSSELSAPCTFIRRQRKLGLDCFDFAVFVSRQAISPRFAMSTVFNFSIMGHACTSMEYYFLDRPTATTCRVPLGYSPSQEGTPTPAHHGQANPKCGVNHHCQ